MEVEEILVTTRQPVLEEPVLKTCINDPTSDCAEVLRFEDNIHDIGCGVNCNHAKLDFILSLINK